VVVRPEHRDRLRLLLTDALAGGGPRSPAAVVVTCAGADLVERVLAGLPTDVLLLPDPPACTDASAGPGVPGRPASPAEPAGDLVLTEVD